MNQKIEDVRRATNPLFNDNKFKLGVFGFNGKGAQVHYGAGPDVTWPRNTKIASMADKAGFEAIVPYVRWKGRPQVDEATKHAPHAVFDTYTWAAGMSQLTDHSAIFATTAIPMIHPIVVAKQTATIDHISGGRFALNVVAGWNAAEFEMFGEPLKSHDDRYEQAAEWMQIIRRLWSEDEEFNFEGRYYKIVKGESFPKPIQKPFPAIMNAGGSAKGAHFAAQYADLCFVIAGAGGSLDEMAAHAAEYKRLAREEYGRTVQVWTTSPLIVRETENEARDEEIRQQQAINPAYAKQLAELRASEAKPLQIAGRKSAGVSTAANGLANIVGSPERIVERISALSAAGIDGVVLISDTIEDELPMFAERVIPLLEQADLRKPMKA